jgi:hypothetical protein
VSGASAAVPRRFHWRAAAPWIAFVLFLPLAFLGLISQANEYGSWGAGGVDCDGPLLLMFAVPAAIAYALLALVFTRRAVMLRSWVSALAVVCCALLVAGLGSNIRSAQAELEDPGYREVCEG